jgi:WD40 repeat protein
VLAFSPDKKVVALSYKTGNKVKVFDLAKKKWIAEFVPANRRFDQGITNCFITRENQSCYVCVDGVDSRLETWDLTQSKLIKTFEDRRKLQLAFPGAITPDDAWFVDSFRVINLKTGNTTWYGPKGGGQFFGVCFAISPDGSTCAVGQKDGTVHVYPTPKGE